ncbi:hypothetical protein A5N17_14875 [Arthrobacter sp. D2]|nr:hypothetical protein [Arthrobacter sp. M5]NKR14738.1 hypothetical protein [Arthrobacter sp. M6]OEH60125.1 hypothetical protein A5N13_03840 [Arthrobacter sp. D4]OEH60739.1 hypothetical protein A5N17_14875 [Arthrobacter sp. D2]
MEHIASVTGLAEPDAATIRNEVIGAWLPELRKKHRDKRRTVNRTYLDGGAPRTDEIWPDGADPNEEVLYGKLLLTQTEKRLREKRHLPGNESLSNHASARLVGELRAHLDGEQ